MRLKWGEQSICADTVFLAAVDVVTEMVREGVLSELLHADDLWMDCGISS